MDERTQELSAVKAEGGQAQARPGAPHGAGQSHLAWHLLERRRGEGDHGTAEWGGASRCKKVIRKLSVVPPITRAKAVG